MKTVNCHCSVCGRITKATTTQWLEQTAYCPACSARQAYQLKPVIRQNNWVTTYQKQEEVKEEEAFFTARLYVEVNPRKVSSKALYGGRTPEEILVYQEEKQQRNFGVPAHKIDPRWAKLLTL